jgi:VWFA-related protein
MAIPLPARRIWPTFLLTLFLAGTSPAVSGDQPGLTYRTGTSEVRLTFSATDQNEHGIATLQATDFAIVDTGFIVRDFQSFTRSDYSKVEIAILIDSSESMSAHVRSEIADTLGLLQETSGVPEENISLLSFRNGRPVELCSGNCRRSQIKDALPATKGTGLTPLYDSIVFASEHLSEHADAQTQKALILFSDGQDTISLKSLRDALDSTVIHNVQIYSIDMNDSAGYEPGRQVLRVFAAASGGRFFQMKDGSSRALNTILEGYRASYSVSYHLPTRARGFHTVQVLPTHNVHLQFRSRSGYYYPDYIR